MQVVACLKSGCADFLQGGRQYGSCQCRAFLEGVLADAFERRRQDYFLQVGAISEGGITYGSHAFRQTDGLDAPIAFKGGGGDGGDGIVLAFDFHRGGYFYGFRCLFRVGDLGLPVLYFINDAVDGCLLSRCRKGKQHG